MKALGLVFWLCSSTCPWVYWERVLSELGQETTNVFQLRLYILLCPGPQPVWGECKTGCGEPHWRRVRRCPQLGPVNSPKSISGLPWMTRYWLWGLPYAEEYSWFRLQRSRLANIWQRGCGLIWNNWCFVDWMPTPPPAITFLSIIIIMYFTQWTGFVYLNRGCFNGVRGMRLRIRMRIKRLVSGREGFRN